MKYKLISFDMDGTLTWRVSAMVFTLTSLSMRTTANKMQKAYNRGKIDDLYVATEFSDILKGLSEEKLKSIVEAIPLIKGIQKTVDTLKENGFVVGITSVGPSFAIDSMIERFGFDFGIGTKHEIKNGVHAGRIERLISLEEKPTELLKVAKSYGVKTLDEVIAIGDSRSDIDLFRQVGFSIALNATEEAKKVASISIDTDNLFNIVEIVNFKHQAPNIKL